ncbi:unnamed protein product [Ranitomeya imitator]|uniref:Uncharacterized protein n=1 Tax=Ranitomeya imitator TaxID=111125 RepID=A0ABN9LSW4_9NEOB|nr:unnamed protein product [Ranitomeya imitator]
MIRSCSVFRSYTGLVGCFRYTASPVGCSCRSLEVLTVYSGPCGLSQYTAGPVGCTRYMADFMGCFQYTAGPVGCPRVQQVFWDVPAITCRRQDGAQSDITECLKQAGPLPPLTQPCQIPCQDDCQFTNWSKFSPCNGDCGAVRTRKRSLLGKSKKKDKCKNSQLYPMIETQFCPCDKYNAQPVGNWSDCILPEGKVEVLLGMKVQGDIKECGQGYRYQAMACYDQNNRLVETSRCNSHGEYLVQTSSIVVIKVF